MITVIGGIKGGSGKTTIATNLTVVHSLFKKRTLLIDADDQKTASDWNLQRKASGYKISWDTKQLSGQNLRTTLMDMQKDYEEVIIDTGGRDTTSQRAALTLADMLVAPFQPRSFDIWTLKQLSSLTQEVSKLNPKLKIFAVINRADPRGKDNEAAINMIEEQTHITSIPIALGQRKSFANASAEGLSVIELKPKDSKAITELKDLYESIYGAKNVY